MYWLKKITHSAVEENDLREIIKIKSVAWNYGYKKQIAWIKSNLKNSDLHILLFDKGGAVAYLNLISIFIKVDTVEYEGYGIGNVCVIEKGKGLGLELMDKVSTLLREEKKIGLLFCREELINFYAKSGWAVVGAEKISLSFDNKDAITMFFDNDSKYEHLSFQGKPF
jgi:predicted GNAT family N-acyltransferase